MTSVGVVGYGRFGQFWADCLKSEFDVFVTDAVNLTTVAQERDVQFTTLDNICGLADAIFLCVPISKVENTLLSMKKLLRERENITLLDTCSVKVYPSSLMQKHFGDNNHVELIATHPMFGPDSGAQGIEGLPIVIHPLRASTANFEFWRGHFDRMGLNVVELSPEKHDMQAAYTQGVTHFIGRVLNEMHLVETSLDTQGYKLLVKIINQTCRDTWELFSDLQSYNPYTYNMRKDLQNALSKIYDLLVPGIDARIGILTEWSEIISDDILNYCNNNRINFGGFENFSDLPTLFFALETDEIQYAVVPLQTNETLVEPSIKALSQYQCQLDEIIELSKNEGGNQLKVKLAWIRRRYELDSED